MTLVFCFSIVITQKACLFTLVYLYQYNRLLLFPMFTSIDLEETDL